MRLTVVMPVYDDWESCRILLARLDALAIPGVTELRAAVVDDCSSDPCPADLGAGLGVALRGLQVVELACNVGHQRAIALGLAVVARADPSRHVLVMDADGEDDPADLPRLVAAAQARPDVIVAAGRAARSEGAGFRLGYAAYRALFQALTGRSISFGNYALLGPLVVRRLVRMTETWSHVAASLLRCRMTLIVLPTRRARRYRGRSTMRLPMLVSHGVAAFAVFSDEVFARLLLAAAAMGALAALVASVVVVIRLTTDLATPGWATTVVGVAIVFLMQSLLITLVAAVQVLSARGQAGAQPELLADALVRRTYAVQLGAPPP